MGFEDILNYYERLVAEEINRALRDTAKAGDMDYLEDVACVALNRLPPRYVRHHVDLIFYLSAEERRQMDTAVQNAVADAISFVDRHRRGGD